MPTSRNHQPNQDGLTVPRLLAELQTPKAIILWSVPILLTIWVYYGKQAHFKLLENTQEHDLYSTLYEYTAAFLLMFFIPALIAKVKFGKPLRDLGVQMGNVPEGIRLTAVVLPILVGAAWLGSADAAMQAEYPLAKSTMQHLDRFAIVEVFYLLYYCSWEFLFRGFMLFGLQEPLGTVPAILIQTIPSARALRPSWPELPLDTSPYEPARSCIPPCFTPSWALPRTCLSPCGSPKLHGAKIQV